MELGERAVLGGKLRVQVGDPAVVQVYGVFGCGVCGAHRGCSVRPGLACFGTVFVAKDERRTACL